MNKFESAPFLLDIWAFPWGVAVLDSDGLFCGLSVWLDGDDEPCWVWVGDEEQMRTFVRNMA